MVFIEELRRWLEVRQLSIDGVVVRRYESRTMMVPADPLASSLVRRAEASAARGAVAVTKQLQRLREQGKIDDESNILVPWPDDMKPGSTTDLSLSR